MKEAGFSTFNIMGLNKLWKLLSNLLLMLTTLKLTIWYIQSICHFELMTQRKDFFSFFFLFVAFALLNEQCPEGLRIACVLQTQ